MEIKISVPEVVELIKERAGLEKLDRDIRDKAALK